jgi:hypothetical protein
MFVFGWLINNQINDLNNYTNYDYNYKIISTSDGEYYFGIIFDCNELQIHELSTLAKYRNNDQIKEIIDMAIKLGSNDDVPKLYIV